MRKDAKYLRISTIHFPTPKSLYYIKSGWWWLSLHVQFFTCYKNHIKLMLKHAWNVYYIEAMAPGVSVFSVA